MTVDWAQDGDVAIRSQRGEAVVKMSDSGPGIPVEERDRAFGHGKPAPCT